MKKYLKKMSCFVMFLLFLLPQIIYAQNDALKKLQEVGEKNGPYAGGASEGAIYVIIANLIGVFLSLLGVIFIILIILAGYWWMTASGDEQKLTKAKDTI
jgi:hypothetical protein